MYKVEKTFDVLQGTVPDFSTSDIKLAITLDGKEVEEVKKEEGKNYKVDVQCDKGAKGSWNYSKWQVEVKDFKKGTKCDVSFTTSTEEIPTIPSSDDAIVLSLSDVIHVSTANTFGEFDISQYSHLYIYLYGQTEANLNAMCFSLDNAQIACIGDIPGTSSYRILDITKNKLLKIYNTSLNGAGAPRGNIGWLVVVD